MTSFALWTISIFTNLIEYGILPLVNNQVGWDDATQTSNHFLANCGRTFFTAVAPFLYALVVISRVKVLSTVLQYHWSIDILLFSATIFICGGCGLIGGFIWPIAVSYGREAPFQTLLLLGFEIIYVVLLDSTVALTILYQLKKVHKTAVEFDNRSAPPMEHSLKRKKAMNPFHKVEQIKSLFFFLFVSVSMGAAALLIALVTVLALSNFPSVYYPIFALSSLIG